MAITSPLQKRAQNAAQSGSSGKPGFGRPAQSL